MTVIIQWAVVALMGAVAVLVLALTAVRVAIRRRQRQGSLLRPGASQAMARYVTGAGEAPAPASRAEREALRGVLLETLADLRGSERDLLVDLIERLGFVSEATERLRSRRRARRRQAAERLALIGSRSAAGALVSGLRDRDPLVRTACARTLAQLGDEQVTPQVVAVADHDMRAAPGAASAVVLALARRDPEAITPLLGAESEPEVRRVAVGVAGRLRLATLSPQLRECLADGDELAAAAAEGLGMIGDFDAVGPLRDLARDQGRVTLTRAAAATAIGAIGDPASVPLLEALLRSQEWPLRAAAARGLARLGEEGTAALRRGVESVRPDVREQAEAAMQR